MHQADLSMTVIAIHGTCVDADFSVRVAFLSLAATVLCAGCYARISAQVANVIIVTVFG